jgi:Tol biopolymer transport system component
MALVAAACGGDEDYTAEPMGTIAFSSNRDGNSEIWVIEADGGGETKLTTDGAPDSEPAWAPDGSRLAFTSYRTGPANLFAMNADGSDVQQLTDNPGVDGGARWARDGSRIAFYSFRDQSAGLMWTMSVDGSDPQPVLADQSPGPEAGCAGGFPGGWFPDGQRILFRGSQGGEVDALQICSATPGGSDVQIILSEANVKSHYPALSPDGTKIAFASDRDGNSEVYVMNVDGGGVRSTNTRRGPPTASGSPFTPIGAETSISISSGPTAASFAG